MPSRQERSSTDHLCARDLAATLSMKGLTDVIVSPGSRNAPLIIAFTEDSSIKTHVVIDERAAAHVALGLALETGNPAAVICTSGTAAMNHGPAIAEAFHHNTPLISITADRPLSSLNKGHGQSIDQTGLFSKFTITDYSFNGSSSDLNDMIEVRKRASDIYDRALSGGPVHINVHLEEPLYGKAEAPDIELPVITSPQRAGRFNFQKIPETFLSNASRALVIAGPRILADWTDQHFNTLAGISESYSGIKGHSFISSGDAFMAGGNWKTDLQLTPTSIITVGNPTLSKTLKNWVTLLKIPHIHVGDFERTGYDSFNTLVKSIDAEPLEWLNEFSKTIQQDEKYLKAWNIEKSRLQNILDNFSKRTSWSDLAAYRKIFIFFQKTSKTTLHFANSTSTRYALFFNLTKNLRLHTNRGVAGIDGCTSTAVGHALSIRNRVTLVTGDVAFLYDINGLATVQKLPDNLRIIVINNGGGGIFRWLEGPDQVGLLESHFETKPKTNIKTAASFCGLDYFCGVDSESTQQGLIDLEKNIGTAILEIVTNPEKSSDIYRQLLIALKG
jgi:2-succinyl-5-enolpyruvyl-6-hydroxy-3-cyclohexene-1-carboxylate synthase